MRGTVTILIASFSGFIPMIIGGLVLLPPGIDGVGGGHTTTFSEGFLDFWYLDLPYVVSAITGAILARRYSLRSFVIVVVLGILGAYSLQMFEELSSYPLWGPYSVPVSHWVATINSSFWDFLPWWVGLTIVVFAAKVLSDRNFSCIHRNIQV